MAPKLDKNGGFALQQENPTCCAAFQDDVLGICACRPTFRAMDVGGKKIDVPATFSPRTWKAIAVKLLTLGIGIFTFYWGFGRNPRPFFLAYLTNISLLIADTYLLASFFNSIIPLAQPPPGQTIVLGWRGKATWVFFAMAANLQVVVTIGYWTIVFDGTMQMYSVLAHGVVMVATLIDGMAVNAIPVRMRHWFEFVFPVGLAYGIWSYVHSTTDIGNPDMQDEDPETNDDLIYTAIDWKENPQMAALVVCGIFLILSPLIQVILWFLSRCRRMYVDNGDSNSSSGSSSSPSSPYLKMEGV